MDYLKEINTGFMESYEKRNVINAPADNIPVLF